MEDLICLLADAGQEMAAGRLSSAAALYRKVVDRSPNHLDAQYLLGSLLAELGQLDDAERHLTIAAGLMPESPYVWNNLGNVCFLRDDEKGALAAWEKALRFNPDLPEAWCNMGVIHHRHGRMEEAESCLRQATARKNIVSAWGHLASIAEKKGRVDEALAIYRCILNDFPEHPGSRFNLARLTGAPMAQAPSEMIRTMFDGYAKRFDRHLLGELQYRTPDLMMQTIEQHLPGKKFHQVVDLGCGTGLMGVEIRSRAFRLVGVDLSPKMLQTALARGNVYDCVVEAEVVDFLRGEQRFDLMLAADVLVYIGDLTAWFDAARNASMPSGSLVFSTEDAGEEPSVDWVLRSTGRYAHSADYVRRCGEAAGWRLLGFDHVTLRMESSQPVVGNIFLMER